MLEKLQCVTGALLAKVMLPISVGNYTIQEVLMKITHMFGEMFMIP